MTEDHALRSPEWVDSILETIGETPLIKLHSVSKLAGCTVLAKVEAMNPGLSAKDRVALEVIEQAEKQGKIKPGGTIIESTSGNTGFSLAMACIVKGYNCILCIPDKSAEEKINQMRAMGAEVIVCPSSVKADDPLSYYSQAQRLSEEIPNSFYVNQYFNRANFDAHYKTTGPEIWRQTAGLITHYIATCGTGGTISGTGTYLKEQNPDITVIGVDAYGSILTKYHETGQIDPNEAYSYLLEGVGKKIIPSNVDFDIIDRFIKVDDKNSAFRARQLAKREGIFAGYSSGATIQALLQLRRTWKPEHVVVLLLPDHGSKYMSKIYNDGWMQKQGFIRSISKYAPSFKIQKRLEKVITKYVKSYGFV
ncbi:MAG: cysteine synthase family protein [Saprospiraceae bacterium]|nr:cysteine synthase family protein [Saprospiraceae bacterium]